MYETVLEEPKRSRFGIGSAYGSKDLFDTSASEQPYLGAWIPRKQSPTVRWYILRTPAVTHESHEVLTTDWSEKEDPSTQADLLENEEDQVQELFFRIRKLLSAPYRESLANRLLTLFNDAKEEDPASPGIALGSLRNFYNFLQLHPNLKYPSISLTPDYNVYASWKGEQNQVFSVLFLSNGDVRFVIFKPNDMHPERKIRISGSATTDILKETVSSYGVWDWILNER